MNLKARDSHLHLQLQAKSDAELLKLAANRSNQELSNQAFEVFYHRYVKYLYYACKLDYGKALGNDGVEDLVQDTFVKAFEKAATYRADNSLAQENARLRTQGWLRKIAANLFFSSFRTAQSVSTTLIHEEKWQTLTEITDDSEKADSPKMQLMKEALNTLSPKEQEIMRTIYQWYEPHTKLPSHIVEELTKQYNTTPENIRKIRSRARQKIEAYLKSHISKQQS
ncbi:RNA polymerase, sigma-24 subunit, ECF subfamily [Chloroherpeton thalassium ATCC 35110]|uniref:RNA polymerase, sigma-24 subunit, ECF subfamily n=1 Tax=Chloroherpeton thalassium (strain ATCC 35110 / GB-78) TaxID=517418 RepID=B3QVH6_CHLT3|nr:sigma-70 family RNA polymerase sigma factor [Chloroherpeton thalassium]ACF14576.1 RNA polymerase, sigma-24 subunit, ECF subfamily [Chloroherpeton thalassium ATCC 35110]